MDKISVRVLRDVANNPSIVEILKNNRKITATFDPNSGLVLEGPSGQLPSVAEILQMAYPFEMPSFARPAWYDRKPKTNLGTYSDANIGPHAITERITYTCPEDRNGMIEMMNARATRKTAAAPVGTVAIWWTIQPQDGTERTIFHAVEFYDNNVGFNGKGALGVTVTLFSGDILRGKTRDAGTGGTLDYSMTQKITEFDA